MAILDLLVIVGCVAIGVWIVRSVMEPGVDLIDEGRRAASRVAENPRQTEVRTPPGPRSTPQVVRRPAPASAPRRSADAPRRTANPASAAPARPGTPPRKAAQPAPRDRPLEAWHLVLDVSPSASRREIQDALRLRVARARSERDGDAVRRLIRAAATGITQARGRDDD